MSFQIWASCSIFCEAMTSLLILVQMLVHTLFWLVLLLEPEEWPLSQFQALISGLSRTCTLTIWTKKYDAQTRAWVASRERSFLRSTVTQKIMRLRTVSSVTT